MSHDPADYSERPFFPEPSNKDRSGSLRSGGWFASEEVALIQGALDSMGCALADHEHEWSDGERAIYEEATGLLSSATSDGCRGSDSSDAAKCSPPTPSYKWRLASCRASIRLLLSGCSARQAVKAAGLLGWTIAGRCCVSIYSWCVRGETFLANVKAQPRATNARGPLSK